jgi:predicted dehydrogenase
MENNYPKLHNATWPGVVGKGPDSPEPIIELDTMLDLTAAAEVGGVKFDGVDLFLCAPHVDIDSTDADLEALAEKLRGRGLAAGSLVAPVWPPTGGGSAMGEKPSAPGSSARCARPAASNIGMIGYGFMGRAHSNAYNARSTTSSTSSTARCSRPSAPATRTSNKAKAFADQWGYESVETDWRKLLERKDIDAIDICTPNNLHKRSPSPRPQAGKMILCEKPLAMNAAEARRCVPGGREGRRAEHGLVQLPPRAGRDAGQAAHRRGPLGRSSTTAPTSCRTGRSRRPAAGRRRALWRLDVAAAGSGVTGDLLAHCIDTAIWLNGPITDVTAMTETFIKERKHNLTGKVEKVGIDDACAFLAASPTARWRCSSRPATPAATRRSTRSRSTARTPRSPGTCTTCTAAVLRPPRRRRSSAAGGASTSPTATMPYMGNWWVPGLQIGYEHSFVHQVADFLAPRRWR